MPELLDQLRDEHATISDLLDDLWAEALHLTSQGVADVTRAGSALDYLLIFPTTSHHPTEDLIQQRLALRAPGAARTVGALEADHIALNRRLERAKAAFQCLGPFAGMRARARFYDEVRDCVRHAREHVRREETLLFPAAERALLAADWRDIERAVAPVPVAARRPVDTAYRHVQP